MPAKKKCRQVLTFEWSDLDTGETARFNIPLESLYEMTFNLSDDIFVSRLEWVLERIKHAS